MLTSIRQPRRQLPLVPADLLKAHDVHETYDNRFRACARLLQALWRQAQDLPAGTKRSRNGRSKRMGSRLHAAAAHEGRNFLSPAIAEVAAIEVAYQEQGALIDRDRLAGNLLSSMPLAFNLGAPMRLDPAFAARLLRALLPSVAIERVLEVWFEHSPGRLRPEFTGDRTAFDIAVVFERPDGERGFLGIEVKYSEDGNDSGSTPLRDTFENLAKQSGLYRDHDHAALRVSPFQQLFREHLLCFASLAQSLYAEAHFVLVAPRHNHRIERVQSLYAAFLMDPAGGKVPFHFVELESVIAAFAAAGSEEYAGLLFERYCDWTQIDRLIASAIAGRPYDWQVRPLAKRSPPALMASAA